MTALQKIRFEYWKDENVVIEYSLTEYDDEDNQKIDSYIVFPKGPSFKTRKKLFDYWLKNIHHEPQGTDDF